MSTASDQALIESKLTVGRSTTRLPALRRAQRARVNPAPGRGYAKAIAGASFVVLAGLAMVAGIEAWRPEPAATAATELHAAKAKVVTVARPAPAANSNVTLPATFRPWQ